MSKEGLQQINNELIPSMENNGLKRSPFGELNLTSITTKETACSQIKGTLANLGFNIVKEDISRPWGAFFCVDDQQDNVFRKAFFNGVELPKMVENGTISPKIMLVAPEKRLSWQKHSRRAEFWRVQKGPIGAFLSATDEHPSDYQTYHDGEAIFIPNEGRHRLVGLSNWGVVAEIWIHTDPTNPSNEEDIIRIADDFKRK